MYFRELVLNRLKALKETVQIDGHYMKDMTHSMQLRLVLYKIESEFHFTGDGVWVDRKPNVDLDLL